MSRIVDPFWPFVQLRRELGQMLDNLGVNVAASGRGEYPALNIWEEGDCFHVEAELPGVAQEELEVFTIGDELTIRGRRQPKENDVTYHRRERGMGDFERVVRLPADVDAEKVEAHLASGVLTLRLPKAEAARPRKIKVNGA